MISILLILLLDHLLNGADHSEVESTVHILDSEVLSVTHVFKNEFLRRTFVHGADFDTCASSSGCTFDLEWFFAVGVHEHECADCADSAFTSVGVLGFVSAAFDWFTLTAAARTCPVVGGDFELRTGSLVIKSLTIVVAATRS